MKIYMIRHGETDWNVKGRLQGQSDTELNENGIRLAKVTAKGMEKIPFDIAISSPLKRAFDTARIVLGDRKVPLLTDDRLMELSFGSWEGLGCRKENYGIPSDDFVKFYTDPLHFQPAPDGESIMQLCNRTREFYEELIANQEYQDKTVLIATHGCCMRALLRNVYQDKTDFWHGGVPLNCAVNIIEVTNGISVLLEEDKVYYGKEDCVDFYSVK